MPTYNFALSGGKNAIQGFGNRWAITFAGIWAQADTFSVSIVSSAGDIQLGVDSTGAGSSHFIGVNPTSCFTYRGRVYLATGSRFIFSDSTITTPTGWEIQNVGSGYVSYLSQFGSQDTVSCFSQLQGRLAVFARRSIEIWNTDADPINFAITQTLDNVGTQYPLSVQNIGDFDVLFLDDTGVRSLRTLQVTLNATIDDVGLPVDALVLAALVGNVNPVCSIIDPHTKNYWLYVNGEIFVYTKYPSAKISAWSTYEPRDNANSVFVPQKFVVYNGMIYCRTTDSRHLAYGSGLYDVYSQVTFQLPYLDDKKPDTAKMFTGFEAIVMGQWNLQFSTDPRSAGLSTAVQIGSATVPSSLSDSTYDTGRYGYSARGTHISMKAVSSNQSTTVPAIFSAVTFHYNTGEVS